MGTYVEKFEIPGAGWFVIREVLGYKSMECKRYRMWSRKSSFGTADTLIDAREVILRYALRRLEKRKAELMSKSKTIGESMSILASYPGRRSHALNLKKFQVDPATGVNNAKSL